MAHLEGGINMPTTLAVIALTSAAYSGYQGYQQQKSAKKSASAMGKLQAGSRKIQEQKWERYKKLYRPMEQQVIESAKLPTINQGLAVTGASMAVGKALNQGAASGQIGQASYLGGVGSLTSGMALSQAEGEVTGSRLAEQDKLGRLFSAVQLGKHIPQQVGAVQAQRAATQANIQQAQAQRAQTFGQQVLGIPGGIMSAYGVGKELGGMR